MSNAQPNKKIQANGKIPVEKKGANIGEYYTGAPKSVLEVPDICMNELKSKGLVCRWIDVVELKSNQNFHRQGWVPYKFDCLVGTNKNPFVADSAMDGFLVRARAVLAVKPEADAVKQREFIKRRTLMQSNAAKDAEKAFRKFAAQERSMKVYGDDDSNGEE